MNRFYFYVTFLLLLNATIQPSNQQLPKQIVLSTGPVIFAKVCKPNLEFFEKTAGRFVSIADNRSVIRVPETESEASESSEFSETESEVSEPEALPERRHFLIILPKDRRGVVVKKWEKNPSRWPTQKN